MRLDVLMHQGGQFAQRVASRLQGSTLLCDPVRVRCANFLRTSMQFAPSYDGNLC
ncbi:hypothetical protein JD76_05949 [Micromonospora endolithica]|nr:hypothetical protein JD76_05949 [Micromonospora endolithica]